MPVMLGLTDNRSEMRRNDGAFAMYRLSHKIHYARMSVNEAYFRPGD